jgi:general secretion pathway protein J
MRNKGFTLLEILSALFFVTIVSIIIVGGLHVVLNNQAATEKSADRFNALQMTLLLMTRDFEQAINRPITNAKGMMETSLIGTPRQVTFTHAGFSNPFGTLPRSTLQRTQYRVDKENLIRDIWPVLDQTPKSLPSERILLNTVADLRLEYLDSQKHFQDHWPPSNQPQAGLPLAIRATLTLKNWGKIVQIYRLPGIPNETNRTN